MKHLLKDEKIVSTAATLLVHGLVIVLLLIVHVDFRPKTAEFLEVSFTGAAVPQNSGEVRDQIPPPSGSVSQQNTERPGKQAQESRSISLPQRLESNLPEEEILQNIQPEPGKKFEKPPALKKSSPVAVPRRDTPSPLPLFTKKEKTADRLLFSKARDEPQEISGRGKVPLLAKRNFEIDWQGEIQREIYQKRLPEFPPDVQREAVIQIKFTVQPDGLIGSAILLRKGNSRLENLTLEAFRTWRFNPLPSYMTQKAQRGIITFRFKLK